MSNTPTPLQNRVAQLVHPYRGEERTRAVRMLAEEVGRVERQRDQLEEQVERLEAWKALVVAVEAKWDAQAIAEHLGSRLGESTLTAIQREVSLLLGRVKQLHAAGQDAIDYIDGKHRNTRRVLDGWRKANQ